MFGVTWARILAGQSHWKCGCSHVSGLIVLQISVNLSLISCNFTYSQNNWIIARCTFGCLQLHKYSLSYHFPIHLNDVMIFQDMWLIVIFCIHMTDMFINWLQIWRTWNMWSVMISKVHLNIMFIRLVEQRELRPKQPTLSLLQQMSGLLKNLLPYFTRPTRKWIPSMGRGQRPPRGWLIGFCTHLLMWNTKLLLFIWTENTKLEKQNMYSVDREIMEY